MNLLYDTGALVAADRADKHMWGQHAVGVRTGVKPVVPVVVLAQAWHGGPQVNLSRVLRGCTVLAGSQRAGRAAGEACARAGTSDVVDALVVVTALMLDAAVVTSDPDDLARLADALDRRLRTIAV